MPETPEKTDHVRQELENLKPERLETEDIAFGLKAFKFTAIIPDAGGEQEKLENKLRSIKGVSTVEILAASRSL